MDLRAQIKLVTAGFLAMAAAMGIGRFVYTPILPAMLAGLGWTASDAGLVASANFAGYLAGAIAASRPLPAGLQRRALTLALLLSVLTTGGMSINAGLPFFIGLRFLAGMASAFVIVLASSLVLTRLPPGSTISAIHFAGVGGGILVSAAAVALIQHFGGGWQLMWAASGAIALLAAASVPLLIPERRDGPLQTRVQTPAKTKIALVPLAAAYGLFGFGYVITATFIVTMVRQLPELRSLEAWVWILFGLAAVPSVPVWSWVGARIGLLPALSLACVAEAAGVAASVEWATTAGICFSALVIGGTFMGITALGLMAAQRHSAMEPQKAVGL